MGSRVAKEPTGACIVSALCRPAPLSKLNRSELSMPPRKAPPVLLGLFETVGNHRSEVITKSPTKTRKHIVKSTSLQAT